MTWFMITITKSIHPGDELCSFVSRQSHLFIHSSIKLTPTEASLKKNEFIVFKNLYEDLDTSTPIHFNFHVRDKVRIAKKKKAFEKGYTPRWTEEVFTISNQQHTRPPTYEIQDYNDEDINYSKHVLCQELQKTTQDVYRTEKVIKSKGNKVLVKWKGYPERVKFMD